MSLFVNTASRSHQMELMDDLNIQGSLLRNTLDKIALINKRLGGNSVTLNGLNRLLKKTSSKKVFTIIDLGCGNGDMLREVAKYGRRTNRNFKFIGIDANPYTIDYARELSENYKEINYHTLDVFSEEFEQLEYDIALATLFIHHFKDDEVVQLLKKIYANAKIGLVVNDLHRHKLAYYAFKLVSFFIGNSMVRHDGQLSILRGFKRKELEAMAKKLNYKSSIRWKWAFRYQWVISS